ncbi:MAG: DUF5985 family protein [Moraxellaceae bacterium]|nr:DUF5985 family protein [Moraxellaceae bacterium]
MIESVYVLCTLTSLLCFGLLVRGYRRSGVRLLFWGALAFLGFTLNNAMAIVDMIILPDVELSIPRLLPAVLGAVAMMYGLITEADR